MERAFRSFLSPDLLILDNLGLHRLTGQESADLYELIVSRRRVSSFVITSNRAEELIILPGRWRSGGHEAAPDREWVGQFQVAIDTARGPGPRRRGLGPPRGPALAAAPGESRPEVRGATGQGHILKLGGDPSPA